MIASMSAKIIAVPAHSWLDQPAHNIIQSVNRVPRIDIMLVTLVFNIFAVPMIVEFGIHFQLHKLFHVFLI